MASTPAHTSTSMIAPMQMEEAPDGAATIGGISRTTGNLKTTKVPSAIGVICTYFSGRDQNIAMAAYGGAGSLGFTVGVIFGGVMAVTALLAVMGWFIFPDERKSEPNERKPSLDFAGAFLGTASMILLVFAFSSSEIHGWKKAIVIAPLLVSIVTLGSFLLVERRVKNPIMPLQLWKTPGFAGTWFTALFFQAWW
ncbi:hypothetical protein QFC22_000043 [Naganishia vaughanmartiniae]|uniref:Uncharacterized protein n=1 Tax=Naganishia vaughanmartiniae TaxID=1424756 RepID=A0ACC2XNB1_9TREE|nr:hypothetical protein QFC22_000043 [Naganishia vaughanmartiniae]